MDTNQSQQALCCSPKINCWAPSPGVLNPPWDCFNGICHSACPPVVGWCSHDAGLRGLVLWHCGIWGSGCLGKHLAHGNRWWRGAPSISGRSGVIAGDDGDVLPTQFKVCLISPLLFSSLKELWAGHFSSLQYPGHNHISLTVLYFDQDIMCHHVVAADLKTVTK